MRTKLIILVLVFLIVVVASLTLSSDSGASATAQREPQTVFDIRPLIPEQFPGTTMNLKDFRACERGLYFWVSPGPTSLNSFILRTDFQGNLDRVFEMPGDKEVLDFDVDEIGSLYVLVDEPPKEAVRELGSTIYRYLAAASIPSLLPVGLFTTRLSELNGEIALFVPDRSNPHLVFQSPQPRSPIDLSFVQFNNRPIMAASTNGRIVVVEKEGIVHLIDPRARSVSSATPTNAEIDSVKNAPERSRMGRSTFADGAVSPDGSVYLILGGYRMADGAPVVRLDSSGVAVETIRCSLPTYDSNKSTNNPDGYISSFKVEVTERHLFLASGDGKTAVYAR